MKGLKPSLIQYSLVLKAEIKVEGAVF